MKKLKSWKAVCVVFLLGAVTAVASSAQTFSSLVSFDGYDGVGPYYMSLVQGTDGNFYGTTWEGGNVRCNNSRIGCGTIFRITPGGTITTVHKFCTGTDCSDGEFPIGGLTLGADGSLYGTTISGGTDENGTIFKVLANGNIKTLHNFANTDGAKPYDALIQAADGNFYGTTFLGGAYESGTVFKMTPTGAFTTLYSFCAQRDCADGELPVAGLVQTADGYLYGTTSEGGVNNNGYGTAFKITTTGSLTTLHSFDGTDGSYPDGSLVQGSDGNLYGTTQFRGRRNSGTIFRISAGGELTTVYDFAGAKHDSGAYPYDGLIQATDGNLYGTTSAGGVGGTNFGTFFNIASGGEVTTLHSFNDVDGENPMGGLVQGTDGNFYGTTHSGGSDGSNYGTVFSLSMGLAPFVRLVSTSGRIGQTGGILGQGFTGTTSVSLNGVPAAFTVKSDTFITATIPPGATTGFVTVSTPSGTLTSNVPFHVIP